MGGRFNEDGIGDLPTQTDFGAANLTQHGTAVVQDLDLSQLTKTHFPQTVANRLVALEFLDADLLSPPYFGQR